MKANSHLIVYTKVISIVMIIALPFTSRAQSRDEIAVRRLLEEQTKAWNNGNIEAFMKGYWQSDSLMFIGSSGPKYGYNTTLKNYKKRYPDTAAMGKLHFDLQHVKRLSSDYYFVMGRWNLQRTIGDLQGYFTLLFRKIQNSWLIVSDHTS